MKIKINFGFILLLCFSFVIGGIKDFMLFFLMICVHDAAHYLLARYYDVQVKSIELMPFGCEMRIDEDFIDAGQKAFIYLSGPLTNVVISLLLFLLKHNDVFVFPLYDDLIFANLILGFLNLLPLHPLDGGVIARIILSKFLGNIKAAKLILVITTVAASFLIAVTVYCFINAVYNVSYGVIGVFLFVQSARERENILLDSMKSEISKRRRLNSSGNLMKSERICVNFNTSLKKILHFFNGNKYYIIDVVDSTNRYAGTITEEDVIDGIIKYGYNCTVRDILM